MADQYTSIPVAKVIEGSPNQERTSLLGAKPSPSSSSAQQPAAVRFQTGEGYIPEEIEKQLRRGFLRKVYSILFIQMCVTAGSIATFIASPVVVDYVKQNDWVMWTCLGLYLFTAFAIICCGEMRRKHPHGIICLSVLTIAMSVMVGVISAQYDTQTVLWAALMTCGCVFGLTLFAFQTKYDFTMFGGILCSICLVFLMSMMVFFWFPMSHTVNLVYSGLGALLMCFFIVYDTQLMLGGKHKLAIGLDEYVFAALNLYLDIINLFLYLLQILGGGRR